MCKMLLGFIKKIPFLVSAISIFNIIAAKLFENIEHPILTNYISILFNQNTPLYFNYWLIYTVVAIIISIILALLRKYRVIETVIGIGANLILFIVIFMYIATTM